MNSVLTIDDGRIPPVSNGILYAFEVHHMLTSFTIKFIDDPSSEEAAAEAVTAPGNAHPSEIDRYIFHVPIRHAHERL